MSKQPEGKKKIFDYEELLTAVDLPTGLCEQLNAAQESLKKSLNPLHQQVFWVPVEAAHLTLVYTARVREDVVPLLVDALKEALKKEKPFKVKVRGLELVEGAKKAVVDEEVPEEEGANVEAIWAMIEETEALEALRKTIHEAIEHLEMKGDELEFRPHITVALVEKFRNTREFQSAMLEWQDRQFGEIPVQAVLVKNSVPREGNKDHPFDVVANLNLG